MRNDLVELVFVIDASGSMGRLRDDTIGGFNSLIEKQKADEGETRITAVVFNQSVKKIYDNADMNSIEPLNNQNYIPGGCTALYDGIGTAIDSVGERLAATPEEERPAKVLVVIITDGQENASNEYHFADIKERIERQQNVYSWEFMYLGADLNSMRDAQSLGINSAYSKVYTTSSRGVDSLYSAVNEVTHAHKLASKGDISLDDLAKSLESAMNMVR